MEQVIVTIDEQAAITVEAKGVVGSGCAALTKALEDALGATTGDVRKPEYFSAVQAQQQAKAGR